MASNTRPAVDQIVTDLNKLNADQDFTKVATEVAALQTADRVHFQSNLAEINSKVDMKKLGFSEDFQIVGFKGDQLVARSEDGKQVEYRQLSNMKNVQTADNAGQMQAVGDHGRQMLVRPDGSMSYKAEANKGDCYWRVAADVLKGRSGSNASDTQVANFVNELAAYNKKADPNKLAVGETIEIPPPVEVAPPKAEQATTATEPDLYDGKRNGDGDVTADNATTPAATTTTDNATTPAATTTTDNATTPAGTTTTDNATTPAATTTTDNATTPASTYTTDNSSGAVNSDNTNVPPATEAAPVVPPAIALNADILLPTGENKDIYNPLAPVGQGMGAFGEVWSDKSRGLTASRTLESSDTDPATGNKTNHYRGNLDNSWLFNWTQQGFRADETVDTQGNMTHRKILYLNDWGTPTMKFQLPDGVHNIEHVSSVESTRDAATGNYSTTIQDVYGKRWQATNSADGKVTSFISVDDAPKDPSELQFTPWLGM